MSRINMWFIIFCGQENIWVLIFQMLLFIRYWQWYSWKQLDPGSILLPFQLFSVTQITLCVRLLKLCRISKPRSIWRRTLQMYVIQYWYILSALIVIENLGLKTSDISLAYLIIYPIIGSVSGLFINTRSLLILLGTFVYVARISCNPRRSLLVSFLFKRIRVNNIIFFNQNSGNLHLSNKSLNTSLHFWMPIPW